MRYALFGLLLAALLLVMSSGHLLFLPLFFVLRLGGLFGDRRRNRRYELLTRERLAPTRRGAREPSRARSR
jgi:hypothetical protein